MKNLFSKIQNKGIQSITYENNKNYLFFHLKNKIKSFLDLDNNLEYKNYEFYNEFSIDDEILNFHILKNHILLVGKTTKKIVLFNLSGEKLKEL